MSLGGETAVPSVGGRLTELGSWTGYTKEFRLPNGKRVDAIDFTKKLIKELKPKNARALVRGENSWSVTSKRQKNGMGRLQR